MSASIGNLAAALVQAQGAFAAPKKSHTAKVGAYSYKYSTLDELIDATRPALQQHGIFAAQNVSSPDGGTVAVATVLLHSSGDWIEFDAVALPVGTTPQSVGAAVTYARRYSLGAALNVAAEDDDDAQSVKPAAHVGPAAATPPMGPTPVPPAASDTLAREINAGLKAGHEAAQVKPANKFQQKVQKTVSRYAPAVGAQVEPPPLTDEDIPF